MNTRHSFKYQMADSKNAVIIYYIVVALLFTSATVLMWIFSDPHHGSHNYLGGVDMITTIFLFVVGLNSFKENFGMLLQNGVTRRSLFAGRLATTASLSALLTVADLALIVVFSLLGNVSGRFTTGSMFHTAYRVDGVAGFILEPLFIFALHLAAMMVGYCISLMFYRLNRLGKVLVGAGVPAFFTIVLPMLDLYLLNGRWEAAMAYFQDWSMGLSANAPWMAILFFALYAVLASGFSWLLLRRAVFRK